MDLLDDMTTGTVTLRLTDRTHWVDLPALRQRTQDLLAAGVPLTLLLDLAEPGGPDSAAHYGNEAGDTSWLRTG